MAGELKPAAEVNGSVPRHHQASNRKRRATTAGGASVGILDYELRAFETVFVVDFSANQVLIAHRINQQLNSVLFHARIVFGHIFVEGESVLKS